MELISVMSFPGASKKNPPMKEMTMDAEESRCNRKEPTTNHPWIYSAKP